MQQRRVTLHRNAIRAGEQTSAVRACLEAVSPPPRWPHPSFHLGTTPSATLGLWGLAARAEGNRQSFGQEVNTDFS